MEIKQRRISLGNPLGPGSSIYVVRSQNDLLQMAIDYEYLRLYNQGLVITPRLHEIIVERVMREMLVLNSRLTSFGVPQKLKRLFEIKSKSVAERYCRELQLDEFELFLLIHNCSHISFSHRSKFKEHIPAELEFNNNGIKEMNKDELLKYTKKTQALFEFRKVSHAHLFENNNEWHVFYFNYNDIDEEGKGHWESPHLHYISHLWTNQDKEQILASFDNRRTKFSGYHIKFVQFQYPNILEMRVPNSIFGEQPMLLVINHNIPADPVTSPIPFAHLATRGIWVSSIAIQPNSNMSNSENDEGD